jgi:hypothetical protein
MICAAPPQALPADAPLEAPILPHYLVTARRRGRPRPFLIGRTDDLAEARRLRGDTWLTLNTVRPQEQWTVTVHAVTLIK